MQSLIGFSTVDTVIPQGYTHQKGGSPLFSSLNSAFSPSWRIHSINLQLSVKQYDPAHF